MGKASRRRWQRRTKAEVDQAIAATINRLHPPKPHFVAWLRGIGVISILLGGVGLLQTFFFPAVIALYLGFVLLGLDLYFEHLNAWVKAIVAVVLLCCLIEFTSVVVTRSSPLEGSWEMRNGRLQVSLLNRSDDDYTDLDLKLDADFPSDYVVDTKQLTNLSDVTFADAMPVALTRKGESVLTVISAKNAVAGHYTNFVRVRCGRLPKQTTLALSIALVRSSKDTPIPVESVGKVSAIGEFKGRFRPVEIEKDLSLVKVLAP